MALSAAQRVLSTPEIVQHIVGSLQAQERPALAAVNRTFLESTASFTWQVIRCSGVELSVKLQEVDPTRRDIYRNAIRHVFFPQYKKILMDVHSAMKRAIAIAKKYGARYPACHLITFEINCPRMICHADLRYQQIRCEMQIGEDAFRDGYPDIFGTHEALDWPCIFDITYSCQNFAFPAPSGATLAWRLAQLHKSAWPGVRFRVVDFEYNGDNDGELSELDLASFNRMPSLVVLRFKLMTLNYTNVNRILDTMPPSVRHLEILPTGPDRNLDDYDINPILRRAYNTDLETLHLRYWWPKPFFGGALRLPQFQLDSPDRGKPFTLLAELAVRPARRGGIKAPKLTLLPWIQAWKDGLPGSIAIRVDVGQWS